LRIGSGPVQTLRRTPLYERHAALGARLVPFAGWEMPVQYSGIGDEHRAVRTRAGVFDVSHMGELRIAGDGAHEYLQARLSNDLDRIDAGQAQYTLLTNDSGGIVDDLIVYRRGDDDYLLVVNAGNVGPDHDALAETEDVSADWAYLAVQGPEALERLGVEIEPFAFREDVEVLGVRCLVAGTGYTGERGCELGCAPDDAVTLWDAILDQGIEPCGLGARDTLRLEVCYPLHGNDISPERTPIEAGLGWACALDKDFTGVGVLRRQKEEGPAERLVAFVMKDPGIPRQGMSVVEGGEVTSGTLSPLLGVGIGLGYVRAKLAEPDTGVTIDLRGRPRRARIVRKPFYKREES
jgi:aminomethyltransferase